MEKTDQTTKLLPCPHCGSDDVGPITFKGCNGDVWDEFIACGGCGATAETVEAWNSRAERTCHDASVDSSTQFYCSECECTVDVPLLWGTVNYCPNCGAKVVSE